MAAVEVAREGLSRSTRREQKQTPRGVTDPNSTSAAGPLCNTHVYKKMIRRMIRRRAATGKAHASIPPREVWRNAPPSAISQGRGGGGSRQRRPISQNAAIGCMALGVCGGGRRYSQPDENSNIWGAGRSFAQDSGACRLAPEK